MIKVQGASDPLGFWVQGFLDFSGFAAPLGSGSSKGMNLTDAFRFGTDLARGQTHGENGEIDHRLAEFCQRWFR